MTAVRKFWPLLTGTYTYDKSISTRNRGMGIAIEAPILAYLIETTQGRILYDVGCDYRKIDDPALRARHYGDLPFPPPDMPADHRLPARLRTLGLDPRDIDLVFLGHLHFDHAGGLHDFAHADIHVHEAERLAAGEPGARGYFPDDFAADYRWHLQRGEYDLTPGVTAIESPGHTAGHMSMLIELPRGAPILLCGDAADLIENLEDEIAPGLCYRDDETAALASLRALKSRACSCGAHLWPNHDIGFFRTQDRFPQWLD
jgi:Zn-dependent hydrolases, including glyoxylases